MPDLWWAAKKVSQNLNPCSRSPSGSSIAPISSILGSLARLFWSRASRLWSRFQLRYSPSTQNEPPGAIDTRFDLHDPTVADRNSEYVGCEIPKCQSTIPHRLAIDIPSLVPNLRCDICQQAQSIHDRFVLGPEENRSGKDWDQEVSGRLRKRNRARVEGFRELANIADIGLLRPLATAVKLKILLEANEDGRQRFFVDRHDETP